METINFQKRKEELDAEYKKLDALRQQHIAGANQIWEEQLKLKGQYSMLETLEKQTQEAKTEIPLGMKKNKKGSLK